MIIGCAIMVPSLMITGPSKFFGFKTSAVPTLIGLALLGSGVALVNTPTTPELVCILQKKFGKKYRSQISDLASAANCLAFAFGSLIGPILGGFIYERVGFQEECSIMALVMLFTTFIYFFVVFVVGKCNLK